MVPLRPASFAARARTLLRAVPAGTVVSYGQVAALLSSPRAARQVGYAMAGLPADTDVPWHRVIRSSGGLAFEGDVSRALLQRALLRAEGVTFTGGDAPDAWRVDLAAHGWRPDPAFVAELLAGDPP